MIQHCKFLSLTQRGKKNETLKFFLSFCSEGLATLMAPVVMWPPPRDPERSRPSNQQLQLAPDQVFFEKKKNQFWFFVKMLGLCLY
jgi:hypothetical protein